MRINKYLKEKGYSTRRGADELINKGAVTVNGKLAKIGMEVLPTDEIVIKGKKGVREENLYYIAYNKPIGILTNKDSEIGKDIISYTNFKNEEGDEINVFPVGRLDKDSHGLIIMTNDGRITDKLLSPRFLHEKEYIVTTDRPFTDFFLSSMSNGVRMDGSVTRKAKTRRVSENSFAIILTEGKKRQIRRMCEALHHAVVDLCRIRIMNIELGKLKPGEYRQLSTIERKELLKSLYVQDVGIMMMAPKSRKPKPAPVKKVSSKKPTNRAGSKPKKSKPARTNKRKYKK